MLAGEAGVTLGLATFGISRLFCFGEVGFELDASGTPSLTVEEGGREVDAGGTSCGIADGGALDLDPSDVFFWIDGGDALELEAPSVSFWAVAGGALELDATGTIGSLRAGGGGDGVNRSITSASFLFFFLGLSSSSEDTRSIGS